MPKRTVKFTVEHYFDVEAPDDQAAANAAWRLLPPAWRCAARACTVLSVKQYGDMESDLLVPIDDIIRDCDEDRFPGTPTLEQALAICLLGQPDEIDTMVLLDRLKETGHIDQAIAERTTRLRRALWDILDYIQHHQRYNAQAQRFVPSALVALGNCSDLVREDEDEEAKAEGRPGPAV